jgi:hypothetical protein
MSYVRFGGKVATLTILRSTTDKEGNVWYIGWANDERGRGALFADRITGVDTGLWLTHPQDESADPVSPPEGIFSGPDGLVAFAFPAPSTPKEATKTLLLFAELPSPAAIRLGTLTGSIQHAEFDRMGETLHAVVSDDEADRYYAFRVRTDAVEEKPVATLKRSPLSLTGDSFTDALRLRELQFLGRLICFSPSLDGGYLLHVARDAVDIAVVTSPQKQMTTEVRAPAMIQQVCWLSDDRAMILFEGGGIIGDVGSEPLRFSETYRIPFTAVAFKRRDNRWTLFRELERYRYAVYSVADDVEIRCVVDAGCTLAWPFGASHEWFAVNYLSDHATIFRLW